jgi:hypothetical protein
MNKTVDYLHFNVFGIAGIFFIQFDRLFFEKTDKPAISFIRRQTSLHRVVFFQRAVCFLGKQTNLQR